MIAEELRNELTPLQQAVILRLWDITSSEVTLRCAADGGVICHLCRIPAAETLALRDSVDCLEQRMKLEDRFSLCLARDEESLPAMDENSQGNLQIPSAKNERSSPDSDCILLEVWGKTVDDALSTLLLQLGRLWSGWHLSETRFNCDSMKKTNNE